MTIGQALAQLQTLKPCALPREQLVHWLSQEDETIFRQLVCTHAFGENLQFTGYDGQAASGQDDVVLLAPDPYSRLYLYALAAQMDLQNQEYDLYANDAALYNRAFADYRNYYNRRIPPLQPATLGKGG